MIWLLLISPVASLTVTILVPDSNTYNKPFPVVPICQLGTCLSVSMHAVSFA